MAKDVVIRNVDYDDVPFVKIPIQDSAEEAYFWDTSDATLTNGNQMLAGYSGYGAGGVKVDGSIPAKSSADLTASGATVTVPSCRRRKGSLCACSWLEPGGYSLGGLYLAQATSRPQCLVLEYTASNNRRGEIRVSW